MIFIALLLMALTAYFGWLGGRRYERGRIELEQEAHKAAYANDRQRRTGGIRLNAMQIRR